MGRSCFTRKFSIIQIGPLIVILNSQKLTFLHLFLCYALLLASSFTKASHQSECVFEYENVKFGLLSTPNFPAPFSVPIHCRWVIRARIGDVIALYFTQFYLRQDFTVFEYAFYMNESVNAGGNSLTPHYVDSSLDLQPIVSNKPTLVFKLDIDDVRNIHVRSLDFFMDVHGFNITFQTIQKDLLHKLPPYSCNPFACSLNGVCLASANHRKLYCNCFPKFYGEFCQFGPDCSPQRGMNPCKNGRTCSYYAGNRFIRCDCLPGHQGEHCARSHVNPNLNGCIESNCTSSCPNDSLSFDKPSGETFSASNTICAPKESARFLISLKIHDINVDLKRMKASEEREFREGLKLAISSNLKPYLHPVESHLRILKFRSQAIVDFHFYHLEKQENQIRSLIQERIKSGRLGSYKVDKNFLFFKKEPALKILSLDISNQPIEGMPLAINCIVVGSSSLKVKWFHGSFEISFNASDKISGSMEKLDQSGRYQATLNIPRPISTQDNGVFTCKALDWEFSESKSVIVKIIPKPDVILTPLSLTVNEDSWVNLVCFIIDHDYLEPRTYARGSRDVDTSSSGQRYWVGYNWLKNGQLLSSSIHWDEDKNEASKDDSEIVEDLYPTGSRLLINRVQFSTTYTCLVSTPWGSVLKESRLRVLSGNDTEPPADKIQTDSVKINYEPLSDVSSFNHDHVTLYGLIFLVLSLLVTMIFLLFRCLKNAHLFCLRIQLCFALMGLASSLLLSSRPDSLMPYWTCCFTLVYFHLTGQCLHLCLSSIASILCLQKSDAKRPVPSGLLSLVGWLVPLSLTGTLYIDYQSKGDFAPKLGPLKIEPKYWFFIAIASGSIILVHFLLVFMCHVEMRICSKAERRLMKSRQKAVQKIFIHSLLVSTASTFYLFAILFLADWNGIFANYLYSISSCAFGLTVFLSFSASSKMDAEILSNLSMRGKPEEVVNEPDRYLQESSIPMENIPLGKTVVFIHSFEQTPQCENF